MSADSPDIMDPRIARARAMRQAGAETAEIARACGVGVSTIYRWTEAHGFRVADLEAAAWAASGRGDSAPSPSHSPVYPVNPCSDLSSSQPEWIPRTRRGMTESEGFETAHNSPDHVRGPGGKVSPSLEVPALSRDLPQDTAPHAEGGPGSSPGFQAGKESEETDDAEITAEQWAAMARGLKQRALRLTEAGRLRQAEQALRLAERYERMQASAAPAPAKDEGVDYRALLEAKLTRLHEHLREKAGLKEGEDFTDAHRAALGIPPLPPEYGG
ncbi:helix-turn-helix domain-containing protein [Oceanicaulis alexandrii]|uniref:helix-turn-helix domain-containing protein n=1 Tax=Oceanicaulis alexandrii TaxID=153233 RepID=UPI003B507855